jgi:hypothetical protein
MNLREDQKQYLKIEYQRLIDKMLELERRRVMKLKMNKKSVYLPTYLKDISEKYTQ